MPKSERYIQPTDDRDENNQSDKFEKKENIIKLHEFSGAVSEEIIQKYGGKRFVDKNIKINTEFFCENDSYTEEKIKKDEKSVQERKDEFERKKKKRKDNNGELFEEVMACILHRILKEKYLVVRSSDYDDLNNGIDLLIINPETNEIIFLVDNITTFRDDFEAMKAIEDKEDKVLNKNMNGGAEMEYGFAFKENEQSHNMELTGERRKGIPIFSMHLYGKELDELLNGMDYNINNDPSKIELDTFDELIRIMKVEREQMIEKIQEKSEGDIEEMKEKEIELNYLQNVKMKDKKGKGKTREKIRIIKEDMNNYQVRKENKEISLASLKKTEILFEKIKEVRNNSFQEIGE